MGIRSASPHAHLTLAGATLLHAFTHAYATMFHPLYLLMRADLQVERVSHITLLVTLYGVVYWGLSYPAGLLADRFDRRLLLAVGLLGNAAAITAIGFAGSYPVVVALCVVAGVFGSLFHPCANALVPAHYPKAPGMAIGLLGIGSGIGFFAGPFLSGLLAKHPPLSEASLPAWQQPFVLFGLAGVLVAVLFYFTAREAGAHASTPKPQLPPGLRGRTLLHAVLISLREFCSVGATTLAALYLLKALRFDTEHTGRAIGLAMLSAAFVNPVIVYLTAGHRRLPAHVIVMVLAGLVLVSIPLFPPGLVLLPLLVFQALSLASSAVGDAGLAERIDPHFRGRVNGLFLTLVGTSAATSPLFVGLAVDLLGERSSDPAAFLPLFAALALLILAGTSSAWSLSRLATK